MSDSVLTKTKNYRLWQGGEYGNKLRAWRSVAEWKASGFAGKVVLRTVGVGGGPCAYNLDQGGVDPVVDGWLALGIPLDGIMVNEAAPDDDVILQGEYLNDIYEIGGEAGWGYLRYSRAEGILKNTSLLNDLIEYLYNFWRSYDRFIITDRKQSEDCDAKPLDSVMAEVATEVDCWDSDSVVALAL